ncbi:alpha/beta hydrolase [Streptomyces chattanoogensis]|uniref:alpha/beta hydrolase n=1 Tax=Streptomyces chattanoogensis TaxID=66876 RepID=UPI0036853843
MASRPRSSRLRRTLLAALVTASVAVPVSGAARPTAVPAPVPAELGPLTATPAALDARYAANRAGIRAAARMAAGHGDRRRAAALRTMAGPARHFLSFDGRDGGRTAEVFGDLAHAGRIAVLVPGSDTGLETYGRFRDGAVALQREMNGRGGRSAVIAWLGYETPGTVSPTVLTPGRAEDGARQLRSFIGELSGALPRSPGAAPRISLVCHSYGSVVCGRAAPSGLRVADIILYGSPGTGADTVGQLHTRATVWAGRGTHDWVAGIPHGRLPLLSTTIGFGPDPMSREFGARIFDAGDTDHSHYLRPGSVSLRNIARIATASAGPAATPPGGRRA